MAQKATYTATASVPFGGTFPEITKLSWTKNGESFSQDLSLSIDPSLTPEAIDALNALNIGIFDITNDGVTITIQTKENTNVITTVVIGGVDVYFVETDVILIEDVYGCKDPNALNYNPLATVDNGSCYYNTSVAGCTDPSATNYNPYATVDDGSCLYAPSIEDRIRCCFASLSKEVSEKEMRGEVVPCAMMRKLQYLQGVVYILDSYVPVGDVTGYTHEVTGTIIDEPNYLENTQPSIFPTVIYYKGLFGERKNAIQIFSPTDPAILKIYIELNDGTFSEPIGSVTGIYAGSLDALSDFNDLFNNRLNPNNPNGLNEILSNYSSDADTIRLLLNTFSNDQSNNLLRSGQNNSGAFRNNKKLKITLTRTYTSDLATYSIPIIVDSSAGYIQCNGTPMKGTVSYTPVCANTPTTLTATMISTSYGMSYQWQRSDDDGATDPYTDIAGETNTTLTDIPDDKWYRIVSVCSFSGLSNHSDGVQFSSSPSPILVAGSGGDTCVGNTVSFTADNIAPGQSTGNSYYWEITDPNNVVYHPNNPIVSYPTNNNTIGTWSYKVTLTNQYGCSETSPLQTVEVVTIPVLEVVSVGVDSITISATGGTPPYDFTVDLINFNQTGIFTGLSNGMYYAYCSDAYGCHASNAPLPIAIPALDIDVLADGIDELVVTNINGTAPFTFFIYDVLNNLLTVDISGDSNPATGKADGATTHWVGISGYSYVTPPKNLIIKVVDSLGVTAYKNYTIP